ncbi:MAG: HIT domain-containing protein [Lentimicrobiaceae bacterium]
MENNCPFCNPEVVATSFADESGFFAIYNHAPVVPGHSMVIPFKHCQDLMELTDDEFDLLFRFVRKITCFLNQYFKTTQFDWSLQQGIAAGQSVSHMHVHIIPRKVHDLPEGQEWYFKLNEDEFRSLDSKSFLSTDELNEMSDRLRKAWVLFNSSEKKE